MYERFTDRARKVMQLANQEAQRFNHVFIGTEHILLGLVKEGSGVAANVLKNLNIDLRKMRQAVEKVVPAGPDTITMGKLAQTPRMKKVIDYAIEEARNLNHNFVGTEHLLLGLLREEEGVAAQVLTNLGLKLEDVREEVLNLLGQAPLSSIQILLKPTWAFRLGKAFSRTFKSEGASRASSTPLLQFESDGRIPSLDRQLASIRFLLGALLGASAGALLADRLGALTGLLVGGGLAALGRSLPLLFGATFAGAFVGAAHLADLGGGLTGAVLGALLAACLAEVGPIRRR